MQPVRVCTDGLDRRILQVDGSVLRRCSIGVKPGQRRQDTRGRDRDPIANHGAPIRNEDPDTTCSSVRDGGLGTKLNQTCSAGFNPPRITPCHSNGSSATATYSSPLLHQTNTLLTHPSHLPPSTT